MNTARKLIANELLPVYQTTDTGEKIVDGRELHEHLGVSSKFADWIKNRIEKYEFTENEDYCAVSKILENGGRSIDYVLKLDMAKELAMVENNEQGRKARKYFIEVEKRFNKVVQLPPQVPVYTPYPEIDKADRLLHMLRQHQDLVNQSVNDAVQSQVVELIAGKPLPNPKKTKPDGLGTAAIASFTGVSVQRITGIVKKHRLKRPEYGSPYVYDYQGASREIFLFNDAGKTKIVELLETSRAR